MSEELEMIFELAKKYPNDHEFGMNVRFYLKQKQELEKLMNLIKEERKKENDLENN